MNANEPRLPWSARRRSPLRRIVRAFSMYRLLRMFGCTPALALKRTWHNAVTGERVPIYPPERG